MCGRRLHAISISSLPRRRFLIRFLLFHADAFFRLRYRFLLMSYHCRTMSRYADTLLAAARCLRLRLRFASFSFPSIFLSPDFLWQVRGEHKITVTMWAERGNGRCRQACHLMPIIFSL